MSYKAVFEFILLLHDFKNIELPNQGLASISASIYKEEQGKPSIYAIPYQFPYNRTHYLNKKKIRDSASIEDMFFRSKVAVIRYSDQAVPLDDFVQFRMELEAFPTLNTQNIYLELNLLFSNRYYSSQESKFEGKAVSQVKMRLKQIEHGIIAYSEADFKDDYFSKVSFTLYGQLMYYKFEMYHISTKEPTFKQISRAKIDSFSKLLIWAKQNYLNPGDDPFDIFYMNYVKNLRHSNYLVRTKLNDNLLVKRKLNITVSLKFLKSLGKAANQQVDEKMFRKYLQSYKTPLSLEDIPQEIHQIRIQNFEFLNTVVEEFYHEQLNMDKLKKNYYQYIREKYGERVFKNTLYQFQSSDQNALKQNKKIAKQMRIKNLSLVDYPIQNSIFLNQDDHQFIFYEITLPQYMKEAIQKVVQVEKQKVQKSKQNQTKRTQQEEDQQSSVDQASSQNTQKSDNLENNGQFFQQNDIHFSKLNYSQKNMLIVMCHGFQGSSYDMACIHKGLKAVLPQASYLLSRKNEDDTEGDIEVMGQRLADQIKYYIKAFMQQEQVIINFVGHSMGGVIARASFQHLTKYKEQFGFYCSLSSPHLGYLNGVDNKIKVGLWALRKWKPIKSLDQLSMQQTKNPRQSFLYKLSKSGTLKYFRKVILFSSFQDSYVSWHSARISQHHSKNSDSKIQREMVENILGLRNGLNKETTIHRLDVNFNVKGNDLDSLIGRAAHINLIVQDSLFDVINTTLPRLFDLQEYKTGFLA